MFCLNGLSRKKIILTLQVFFNPFGHVENPFGSSEAIFEFIACWKAPEESVGNKGESYLTFFSSGKAQWDS